MYHLTFGPQSNRASWVFIGMVTDYDDEPLDLSTCSLLFHIYGADGYECLTASTENGGITIVDMGVFRWFFSLNEMQSLRPQQHATGLTLTNADGDQTIQLSVGPLNIVDGVVPHV